MFSFYGQDREGKGERAEKIKENRTRERERERKKSHLNDERTVLLAVL
jgi:hypothetical protein